MEGIETSLHGSGQLDYDAPLPPLSAPETSSSLSINQITPTTEAVQVEPSRQSSINASVLPTQLGRAADSVGGVSNDVGVASRDVGVVSRDVGVVSREVEELKNDMTAVWSMNRDVKSSSSATAPPTVTPHTPITTVTPSQPPQSHSQTSSMEWEPHHPTSSGNIPPTHTVTPSHPPSPHNSNPAVATTTTNPVAMETEETPESQTNQQSTSEPHAAAVSMTTEQQISTPWFSLTPRSPCETKPAVTMATTALQNGITEAQYQLVTTATGGQQLLAQATPSGMMQYYITPSGAIAAAPSQQLQVGYALVGNTLVPQQYMTTPTAAPQQQFLVTQGGVQYLVGGGASGLLGLGGMAMLPQTGGGVAIGQGGALVQTVGGGGGAIVLGGGGGGVVVVQGDGTGLASANTTASVAAQPVSGERAQPLTNHIAAPINDDVTPSVVMETREVVETKPVSPVVTGSTGMS